MSAGCPTVVAGERWHWYLRKTEGSDPVDNSEYERGEDER